ncbi:MAG: hypothetical protein LOY58_04795 [Gammaproteobacteria bacterium]|jgi:hypothetical protein|nr:hypothetical protein [Gammaproteobacteria bacterium]
MTDPLISAALLILWTVAAGTWLSGHPSRRVAFWGSTIPALALGLLFTAGAYHVRNAYLSLPSSPGIMAVVGFVWAMYLALPTAVHARLMSARRRGLGERFGYSVVAAFLQAVFCVAPSFPWLIMLSLE